MQIQSKICGIPCIVKIMHFVPAVKTNWHCRMEDAEPPSTAEIDWEICDMRGRPAPWLERKLNSRPLHEQDAVEQAIIKEIEAAY